MYRKLCFLTSFILVFALGSVAQAVTPIDVNNFSFELDPNGNRVPGHTGYDGILAWKHNYPIGGDSNGWVGVDVFCPYADSTHCHHWPGPTDPCGTGTDVVYSYLQNTNTNAYQVLDMNNSDANAVIASGRRYTLTYDAMGWNENKMNATLFYPTILRFPDANHIELTSRTNTLEGVERELSYCNADSNYGKATVGDLTVCPDWTYNLTAVFVAEPGKAYLGKTLGIKFKATPPGGYVFIDNIRLDWQWATQAYGPSPADGATEVSKSAILKWSKGLWAKSKGGHDVYFGTDWADVNSATTATAVIFKGNQDANSYDPPGTVLTLGETYYWRIDEVNAGYVPGPVPAPPDGKWRGDVWSFTVSGRARKPYPPTGATDIPRNVILRWMSGAECKYHDVYFGTDGDVVEAATTATSGIYKTRINRTTEELQQWNPSMNLRVNEQYFWRIDEVNTLTVKGYVWDFKVAGWILVDDFDFYASSTALNTKWKAVSTVTTYLLLNKDANFAVEDSNSMQWEYTNDKSPYLSEAKRTYSPAEDWSYTGNSVTLLELNFFGDANNIDAGAKRALDPPMYVKLSDGTKTAQVNYPDANNFIEQWQHTWNIPLKNFSDKGVTLSKISSIVLGMGNSKGESGEEKGTMYFDDIMLRPPRCVTEYGPVADFTDDCNVDNADLEIMATDWLMPDGLVATEERPAELNDLTFTSNPSQWVTGHIGNALAFDGVDDKVDVVDPRLIGLKSMTISAWVKRNGLQPYIGIVTSREYLGAPSENSTELASGSKGGSVGYCWNQINATWQWDSGLVVPDLTWTFVAMSVDSTGATLYAKPTTGSLTSARHTIALSPLEQFQTAFWIGRGRAADRYYKGTIDDVRIYGRNLSFADINNLAYETVTDPNPGPVYWYKLDETTGFTAADSGFGGKVYSGVRSKANLTDPEAELSRSVNLRDFAMLADEWLTNKLWPLP